MRELTLMPTKVELNINGKKYTAHLSDVEIISMANEMQKRFAELMSRAYTLFAGLLPSQQL